jgi:hypothetical protein
MSVFNSHAAKVHKKNESVALFGQNRFPDSQKNSIGHNCGVGHEEKMPNILCNKKKKLSLQKLTDTT